MVLTPPLYQPRLVRGRMRSLLEEAFELRCFQLLRLWSVATLRRPLGRQVHQRLQSGVPFVLSGSSSQSTQTLPADSNRSGSRRSKPSSRSVLMGEPPHPWLLLHSQDTESRHRSNKPVGRCELAPQTIQLSLEYLFCHTWASLIGTQRFARPRFRAWNPYC